MKNLLVLLTFIISTALFSQSKHNNNKSIKLHSDTIDVLHYTINLKIIDNTNHTISGNTELRITPKN